LGLEKEHGVANDLDLGCFTRGQPTHQALA
jgi:hypothetical protein